jgi:hypothetical protein
VRIILGTSDQWSVGMTGVCSDVVNGMLTYNMMPVSNVTVMKWRDVRFQVLMAASMKHRIFWDVLPCS